MGEYAEEAIQNGMLEEPRKKKEWELWWIDVTGRSRPISAMDSLHLCFILNYQLQWGRSFADDHLYYRQMQAVLWARNWDSKRLEKGLEQFQADHYEMYPHEGGQVEAYYQDLLQKYPDYSWKPLKYYMQWERKNENQDLSDQSGTG